METDNTNLLAAFLSAVKSFSESSQNLETNTLSELFEIVKDVYNPTDLELRKQREVQMISLRTSPGWAKYVLQLSQILAFSGIEKKEMLQSLAFEICATIEKRANQNADVAPEELLILISANIYLLLNKDFSVVIAGHLAKAVRHLFSFEFNEKNGLQRVIEKYVISILGEATIAQSLHISLILRHLTEIKCEEDFEYERIQNYLQTASNLGIARLNGLANLSQNVETAADFGLSLHTIYYCIEICSLIFKKVNNVNNPGPFSADKKRQFDQFFIFENNEYLQQALVLTEKVLSLDLNNSGIKLISFNTMKTVDDVLNKAKKLAVKNAVLMFGYIYHFKNEAKMHLSEYETAVFDGYTNNFSEFLKFFLTQLHTIIIANYSSDNKFSPEQKEIVREVLVFLKELVCHYQFYELFLSNRVEITLDIVINLLLTTSTDYAHIKEDPRDFTSFEEDLVEEGESDDLKANAVHFYRRYCERIDGTLSWFTALILKVIKVSLNSNEDYEDLIQYRDQGSLLFSDKVNPRNRIETSLLCLIIVTKQMISREDLIKDLDRFFAMDFKLLFSVDSEIVKCRICLFMKQMIPSLFQRNDTYFKETLKYLFECSICFEEEAVSYQALSAIESIVDKNGSQYQRSVVVIDDMLIYLFAMIERAKEEPYFDFLQTVLETYEELSYEYGGEVVKRLCSRTWNEFQELPENEKTNIVIAKCLETIRSMVASQDVMDSHYAEFEDDLQNLFTLLDSGHKIDFDDGLLSIATEIAKRVSMNTAVFQIVKKNMLRVLENNNYRFDMFFELFEYWCKNGHHFILTDDPELLEEMVKVCLEPIKAFSLKRIRNDYESFSMAAVSLQLIIQSFGDDNISAVVPWIIGVLAEKVKTFTSDADAISCFRLLQIYYCLIYYCSGDTLKHLRDERILQLLTMQMPHYYLNYFKYDNLSRKTITLGLIAMLYNRNQLQFNNNMLENTFLNLVRILGNTPGLQRTTKNTIVRNQIDEIQDTRGDYFNPGQVSEEEVPILNIVNQDKKLFDILKTMEFVLMELDEFNFFSIIFKIIKEEHQDIMQAFFQTFDKETIQKFEDVLMTKNYPSQECNKIETRRNVVVKKRNPNMNFE